jgi:peptide/nickel transport system ATP-binding protein
LVVHGLGGGKSERLSAAKELMEKVGLKANQLNRYPHEFSGGQRQRICIARALMLRPEFVICDESVSALDVSIQAQVLNLLLDLQQEFKLTYIFISHDLGVVNFISDEVGVMNGGRLVEMGNADRIYKQPREEYTKTLLGAIPKGLPKNLESFLS